MRDERTTTFEYALLGLLSISPMSGYDVQRVFATTPLAHYSSSPGSIYPALKRLVRRGLVEQEIDRSTELRPKRVHRLSPIGWAALDLWLRASVTRDEMIRDAGAQTLRFSLMEGALTPAEVLEYVASYERVIADYLVELEEHRARMEGLGSLHQRLALDHGIRGYAATLEWTRHARAEIARANGIDLP